jgi:hypothetical protein
MDWRGVNNVKSRSGIFDAENPPVHISDGKEIRIFAIELKSGQVIFDLDARMHLDVVKNCGINADDVVDGGFIFNGHYQTGRSESFCRPFKKMDERPSDGVVIERSTKSVD